MASSPASSKSERPAPALSAALATAQAVLVLQREADVRQRAREDELNQRLDEASQTRLKLQSLLDEQKRTEAAIREQQRYLDGLIANLPGMAYSCRNDEQWTMTFVSDGCLALTGFAKDELEQNRVVAYGDLVHSEDRDWLWQKCQRGLADRVQCNNEYRIINKAGVICWVWERAFGVYAPDGSLISIEGFVTDVTSRKEAETDLQSTERRYRALFEGAPESVFLISAEPADFGLFSTPMSSLEPAGAIRMQSCLGGLSSISILWSRPGSAPSVSGVF
jgi:PAS domain S-box-containing protein